MTTLFYETVKKGSKLIKDIPVQAPDGTSTVLPCYIINGAEEGPDICITSGVHGTEYPGIAANLKLYHDIDPAKLKGSISGCIMCNYEAFLHKTMFVNPVDGKNLNEVFPGNPNGTLTEIIATTLMQLVSRSDYHIDMHSGDRQEYLNPYVFYHKNSAGRSDIDETALEMAKAYALDYIAVTEFYGEGASDIGNFYASVSELGIPCIQPEIGGLGLVDEKTKMLHYNGLRNVLDMLGMYKAEPRTVNNNQTLLESFYRLKSQFDGVFNCYVEPGELVKKGQPLGNITNMHADKVLQEFTAEADGVCCWRMASLAANKGDALLAMGVSG